MMKKKNTISKFQRYKVREHRDAFKQLRMQKKLNSNFANNLRKFWKKAKLDIAKKAIACIARD